LTQRVSTVGQVTHFQPMTFQHFWWWYNSYLYGRAFIRIILCL